MCKLYLWAWQGVGNSPPHTPQKKTFKKHYVTFSFLPFFLFSLLKTPLNDPNGANTENVTQDLNLQWAYDFLHDHNYNEINLKRIGFIHSYEVETISKQHEDQNRFTNWQNLKFMTLISPLFYLTRNLRATRSRHILMHLCFALLCLYVIFLSGIDATHHDVICTTVAAVTHYLVLASMFWMGVEARNMYLLLVRVFKGRESKFMIKACSFAWGEYNGGGGILRGARVRQILQNGRSPILTAFYARANEATQQCNYCVKSNNNYDNKLSLIIYGRYTNHMLPSP